MDDDLEEFVAEFYANDKVDFDYEFDAARFYDFTRSETDSEAREAERWFESSGNYPPSRKHLIYFKKSIQRLAINFLKKIYFHYYLKYLRLFVLSFNIFFFQFCVDYFDSG